MNRILIGLAAILAWSGLLAADRPRHRPQRCRASRVEEPRHPGEDEGVCHEIDSVGQGGFHFGWNTKGLIGVDPGQV